MAPVPKSYNFPQEIIDLFVDVISHTLDPADARQSLIACTMVSRPLSLPARRQLYSVVDVGHFTQGKGHRDSQGSQYSRFRALKERLEGPTNFGSLIRKLHIDVRQSLIPLADDVELHPILIALRLHAVNVECFWMTGNNDTTWWAMDLDIARTFVDLLASWKRLAKIRISHMRDFTMDFLPSLTTVFCLELVSVYYASSESATERQIDPTAADHKAPQLRELFVHRNSDGFQSFRRSLKLDLSHLRRFQMSIFDLEEARIFSTVTQRSLSSLQSLDLMLRIDNRFLKGGPINIGHFSDLRKLRLRIQTGNKQTFPPMSDIFSLLYPPSRYPTRLEIIGLLFNSIRAPGKPPHTFIPDTMDDDDADAWRSLHPATLRQLHPRLRSLSLGFDLKVMSFPSRPLINVSVLRDAEDVLAGKFKALIEGSFGTSVQGIVSWDISVVVWESNKW